MRVLVACESSGVVREAFNALAGVHAVSCDLLPAADGRSDFHHVGDVREILADGWDLLIAHPPCTYLSVSGMHWTRRGLRDPQLTEDALEFFRAMLDAPIPRVAVENPVGVTSTRIRKPDQWIQPHQFGHDASKKTGLWLRGLPKLIPTRHVAPRIVMHDGKPRERWANQTDSGQNRLGPSPDRWQIRSETYSGIATAMADQWGRILAR